MDVSVDVVVCVDEDVRVDEDVCVCAWMKESLSPYSYGLSEMDCEVWHAGKIMKDVEERLRCHPGDWSTPTSSW